MLGVRGGDVMAESMFDFPPDARKTLIWPDGPKLDIFAHVDKAQNIPGHRPARVIRDES